MLSNFDNYRKLKAEGEDGAARKLPGPHNSVTGYNLSIVLKNDIVWYFLNFLLSVLARLEHLGVFRGKTCQHSAIKLSR